MYRWYNSHFEEEAKQIRELIAGKPYVHLIEPVALGVLDQLPEKPYQVGQDTLNAVNRLQGVYQLPDSYHGVGIPTLLLVNRLLEAQQAGQYWQDVQLDTAIQMAKDALKGE